MNAKEPKMNTTDWELKKYFDKVYEEYRFSKERKENVESLRRKHGVTAKDLAQKINNP